MKILITSARSPAGLELARILHESGAEVFAADSFPVGYCQFSRSVKKVFPVPPPNRSISAYRNAILTIIESIGIDLVIPCYEETFFIASIRESIQKRCAVFADSLEKLTRFHHKFQFIQWCRDHKIAVPETELITSAEQIQQMDSALISRSVFKPAFSRYGTEVRFPADGDSLETISVSPEYPWVRQNRIFGAQFSAYAVSLNGTVQALAVYPHNSGSMKVSVCFEPVRHESAEKWVINFCRESDFTGNISFDLIEEPDGTLYPIECNPRITSGIHLLRGLCGIETFLQPQKSCIFPQGNRRASLFFFQLAACRTVQEFFRTAVSLSRSRNIIFELRDPFPILGTPALLLYVFYISRQRDESLTEASMWDIAYNGEIR